MGPSDRMLILGLGPIGLLAIQAAKLFGVTEIIASDVVPFRREMALKLGATAVINPLQDNISEQLSLLTGGMASMSSSNRQAIAKRSRIRSDWLIAGAHCIYWLADSGSNSYGYEPVN